MTALFFDAALDDDARRGRLYQGDLFVYSPLPGGVALCELARQLAEEAFAPHDPRQAQHHLSIEDYAAILTALKPRFIHHPRAKAAIRQLLGDLDCDPEATYFDVPRLRTATSGEHLKSGIAYAFKPHRDIWYSPPLCQLNWWLPVYPIEPENAMAFHTQYWNRPIKNSSDEFNYQEWVETGRKQAASYVKQDTRRQSEALEPLELDPQVRVLTPPGGLLIFSAAHLHSTVPNTSGCTRLSVDFRTVHLGDLDARRGAPNPDSRCRGTTIGDYLRGTDLTHVPEPIASEYANAVAPAPSPPALA